MSGEGNADVVSIGDIPIEAFGEWLGLTTRNAVVTEERRRHIVERHPDVALDLDELITTVNDPDEAHRYPSLHVVELFRWDGWSHAWTVVIRVASVDGLSNSVLTFHRMRRERVIKRRARADSVWERG